MVQNLRFFGPVKHIFLLIAVLFLGLATPSVLFSGTNVNFPSLTWIDADKDFVQDPSIETESLKIIISSKTGNISVYYLKGKNFNENLIPAIPIEGQYDFASETVSPFEIMPIISTEPSRQSSPFTLSQIPSEPDRVIIEATGSPISNTVSLTKRFTFFPKGYVFNIATILSNLTDKEVVFGNAQLGRPGLLFRYGPGIFLDPTKPSEFLALEKVNHKTFNTIEELQKGAASIETMGIGLKTSYFCLLMEAQDRVALAGKKFDVPPKDKKFIVLHGDVIDAGFKPFSIPARDSKEFPLRIYFGPKILDELKSINREQVTDYGFLSTVLLRILQFFNSIYPNFGLAIIFLTILVRIILYPLTISQTKSIAKMQKIQPFIQDIKDRYKDDQQKFNEEVLKLYQKHQVNPLGGCLPLLLQLPVLIALYNTINIAVELRKTPFLWVADLSGSDPTLILPIAIALLMYYQQGKVADAQQQQMMAFMPMFMFIITWSLPSGLLLYWFTSSVIGVLQQIQANRIISSVKEERS